MTMTACWGVKWSAGLADGSTENSSTVSFVSVSRSMSNVEPTAAAAFSSDPFRQPMATPNWKEDLKLRSSMAMARSLPRRGLNSSLSGQRDSSLLAVGLGAEGLHQTLVQFLLVEEFRGIFHGTECYRLDHSIRNSQDRPWIKFPQYLKKGYRLVSGDPTSTGSPPLKTGMIRRRMSGSRSKLPLQVILASSYRTSAALQYEDLNGAGQLQTSARCRWQPW